MPDEPEVHGLLALMLIHHARREARFSGEELVLLEDQDRSLWDAEKIAAGREALDRALALRGRGPYVLQAAIASLQAEERIDWTEVAALYGQLAQITDSPVVELNRAVAVAEAGATEQALEIVDGLDLDDYQYLHSTRGELLRRLGRPVEARAAYRAGAEARQLRARASLPRASDRRAVDAPGNSRPTHRGCPRGACPHCVLPFVVATTTQKEAAMRHRTNTEPSVPVATAGGPMTSTSPDINRWRAFSLLAVAYFMTIVDLTIVNVSLPTIGRALHFSETNLQWVATAYALTFGGFMLLGGRAADLLGRRRVLMAGLGAVHGSLAGVRPGDQ